MHTIKDLDEEFQSSSWLKHLRKQQGQKFRWFRVNGDLETLALSFVILNEH